MKTISVSQLKARLSENLRLVEGGETIVVLDHKRPVASINPFPRDSNAIVYVRKATRPFDFRAHKPISSIDPLILLEAERADRELP